MKKLFLVIFLVLVIVSGCDNKGDIELLSKKFEQCVLNAELKHAEAFRDLCEANPHPFKPGICQYSNASKDSIDRSRDAQISACAVMYSPKK